jgi:tetratricopeptide (TPR) repeat protein
MVRRFGRPLWVLMFAACAALAIASSAAAQAGGMVRGRVLDDKRQPADGATVTVVMDSTGRKYSTKTNAKGEFIQVGLSPGAYTVTAEKEKAASAPFRATVRASTPAQMELVLGQASSSALREAGAKLEELKKVFGAGVTASNAGDHAAAITAFNASIVILPDCADCYSNIGFSYTQLKDYEKAEAAYKKATELNPQDPAAWSGLANVYNAQRKFDLAADAGKKASDLTSSLSGGSDTGGNADAMFNQGVILWNGGKVAEAKVQFEGAVKANPNHAEAHYQLGMALVNEGNMAGAASEFDTYIKLTPEGPNAATAKSLLAQLKK